jgi:hypothetical protein
MIKILDSEHIKKHGDFQLNELWVKTLKFENVAQNSGKKTITAELVPCGKLEDGTYVFDHDNPKKLYISDASTYLESGTNTDFNTAYFGVEVALATMMQEQYGWTCQFEMPQV